MKAKKLCASLLALALLAPSAALAKTSNASEDELLRQIMQLVTTAIENQNKPKARPIEIKTKNPNSYYNSYYGSNSYYGDSDAGAMTFNGSALLGKTKGVLGNFLNTNVGSTLGNALAESEGVLVVPYVDELGRAPGVVFARDSQTYWRGPAFVVIDYDSSSQLEGNGWVIPLDRSNMVSLRRQTREMQTPDTERSKYVTEVQAFGFYRDHLDKPTMIEQVMVTPAARVNRSYWGSSLYLSEALNGRVQNAARGVAELLDKIERQR